MKKVSREEKQRVRDIRAELALRQKELALAQKRAGDDAYISVATKKSQSRTERIPEKEGRDRATSHFYIELAITAKKDPVYIPLSMASGKKVAGFMYIIEGTSKGTIAQAEVRVPSNDVAHLTIGTLQYVKIPKGVTALCEMRVSVRGFYRESYKIIINRVNYKLSPTDVRYEHYLKEIHSKAT